MYGFTISILALLAACAAPTETTLADRSVAYRIDCAASGGGLNYCFEKAGKSCGAAGYTVYAEDGQTISRVSAGETDIRSVVSEYEGDQNSILIKCDS